MRSHQVWDHVNKLREFGKFKCSHHLFTEYDMDIIGRSYMLITSGSYLGLSSHPVLSGQLS